MSKHTNKFLLRNFLLREVSFIGRQRLMTLIFYESILIVGLIFNITGLTGFGNPLFLRTNALFLLSVVALFVLYVCRIISLKTCLYATTLTSHLFLSAETVVFISDGSDFTDHIALANIILLALNSLYSTISYLKWNSFLLGGMTAGVCVYSMCQMDSGPLRDFFLLILVSFIIMSFCGERLVANSALLNSENVKFRRDEQELLFLFRMKRPQMRAYIHLGRKTYSPAIVEKLFNELSPETTRNIIANVMSYTNGAKSLLKKLKKALPNLTPSEREICMLIIQGKKQSEICQLLNKSKSNVNTQRVHIRKKLSLLPQDNLHEALKRSIGQQEG